MAIGRHVARWKHRWSSRSSFVGCDYRIGYIPPSDHPPKWHHCQSPKPRRHDPIQGKEKDKHNRSRSLREFLFSFQESLAFISPIRRGFYTIDRARVGDMTQNPPHPNKGSVKSLRLASPFSAKAYQARRNRGTTSPAWWNAEPVPLAAEVSFASCSGGISCVSDVGGDFFVLWTVFFWLFILHGGGLVLGGWDGSCYIGVGSTS